MQGARRRKQRRQLRDGGRVGRRRAAGLHHTFAVLLGACQLRKAHFDSFQRKSADLDHGAARRTVCYNLDPRAQGCLSTKPRASLSCSAVHCNACACAAAFCGSCTLKSWSVRAFSLQSEQKREAADFRCSTLWSKPAQAITVRWALRSDAAERDVLRSGSECLVSVIRSVRLCVHDNRPFDVCRALCVGRLLFGSDVCDAFRTRGLTLQWICLIRNGGGACQWVC